jgi:hypothetical protein
MSLRCRSAAARVVAPRATLSQHTALPQKAHGATVALAASVMLLLAPSPAIAARAPIAGLDEHVVVVSMHGDTLSMHAARL